MSVRMELEGLTSDPSVARHEVERILQEREYTGDVQGVLLLVSELVTNAVRHGSPPISLRVNTSGESVKVAVEDGSLERLPTVRDHPSGEPTIGGYGLTIVDELSDAWGWAPISEERKSVWFTME